MPIPKPILTGSRREYTIDHAFSTDTDYSVRLTLPPWQRPEVWTQRQKQRFVEGIFLGFGTGVYVVNGDRFGQNGEKRPMAGWLLDGQQRICALRDFFAGNLTIFGDVRFPGMGKHEQLRFCQNRFPCVELEYCSDESVLMELYDRLNFSGTPHTEDQRASRKRRAA